MAFLITLGSAPPEDLGLASLAMRFFAAGTRRLLGETSLQFTDRTYTEGCVVDLSETATHGLFRSYHLGDLTDARLQDDFRPVRFDLGAELHAQNGRVEFGFDSLQSNDALHVVRLSQRYFLGHIFHGKEPSLMNRVVRRCVVKCADGKTGHDCVTCSREGITVKICC